MPQEDAAFLQTSADALLNKINTLRCEKPCALNPEASPFTPLLSSDSTNDHCPVITTAEIHSTPKEVLLSTFDEEPQPTIVSQKDDSSSTTDQMPAGSFQQETRELATACWDPQEREDHPVQPKMGVLVTRQTEGTSKNKGVHWKLDLANFHYIEAEGEQKPTSATVLQEKEYASTKRSWCTKRS